MTKKRLDKPKTGKTPVCVKSMLGLQLIPDNSHRAITAKFLTKSHIVQDVEYSKSVSLR